MGWAAYTIYLSNCCYSLRSMYQIEYCLMISKLLWKEFSIARGFLKEIVFKQGIMKSLHQNSIHLKTWQNSSFTRKTRKTSSKRGLLFVTYLDFLLYAAIFETSIKNHIWYHITNTLRRDNSVFIVSSLVEL